MTAHPMIGKSPLTAADRCDRCGAQAYMRVEMMAGELLFCVHHSREYRDTIRDVAVAVCDETGRVSAT